MITIPIPPVASSSKREFSSDLDEIDILLRETVKQIRKSKRIVVICGAGVSTAAAIPDFRGADGLYNASRKGKRKAGVKDLFHIDALLSDKLLPQHHALINDLYTITDAAQPTPFHSFLKDLDDQGRLLRCYTQNIDGLEIKAGLDVGLPVNKIASKKGVLPRIRRTVNDDTDPFLCSSETPLNTPPEHELPTMYAPAPRCIPLHGLLTHLDCTRCRSRYPMSSQHPLPNHHLACPSCHHSSSVRYAMSARQRGIGLLRASIVLYGEDHPRGEDIGWIVERDLKGLGRKGEREGRLDLLLVVGTTLAIPGVKRMVKEMARSLTTRNGDGKGKKKSVRTVFLNAEAPPKTAEWEGVFDIWLQSDIQSFITDYVLNQGYDHNPSRAPQTPRKQKGKPNPSSHYPTPPWSGASSPQPKKRARDSSDFSTPTPVKRRRAARKSRLDIELTPSSMVSTPSVMSRLDFEGSLTPLSDSDEEGLGNNGMKTDNRDKNPFLL